MNVEHYIKVHGYLNTMGKLHGNNDLIKFKNTAISSSKNWDIDIIEKNNSTFNVIFRHRYYVDESLFVAREDISNNFIKNDLMQIDFGIYCNIVIIGDFYTGPFKWRMHMRCGDYSPNNSNKTSPSFKYYKKYDYQMVIDPKVLSDDHISSAVAYFYDSLTKSHKFNFLKNFIISKDSYDIPTWSTAKNKVAYAT